MLHAARWKYRTQKSPKIRCLRTIAQLCRAVSLQLRHVPTIGRKNLLNRNISSTRLHNMAKFGLLTAGIRLPVWGTPANFNWFRDLASLLHQRRSPETNQTLHDVWPFPTLAHYKYIFTTSDVTFTPMIRKCTSATSAAYQIRRARLLVFRSSGMELSTLWFTNCFRHHRF